MAFRWGIPSIRVLSIRGGVREDAGGCEPLSNAIRGDPPKYSVYSLGLGFAFMGAKLNVGYEYGDMKYVDTWSNSASNMREFRSAFMADIAYAVPLWRGKVRLHLIHFRKGATGKSERVVMRTAFQAAPVLLGDIQAVSEGFR